MSKTHVNLYFLQVQNQYFQLLEMLPEYKSLAAEGIWTQEQYDSQIAEINKLKQNYERLAYIIWELNKPSEKNAKKSGLNKTWYDSLNGVSKEAIFNENADVLADFKKYIKEGKDKLVNEK